MPNKYVTIKQREALGLPLKRGDVRPSDGAVFYEYTTDTKGNVRERWLSETAFHNKKSYLYDYGVQRSRFNRAFIKRVKIKFGCADCGYKDHAAALHFDHRDPKEKTGGVSTMAGSSLRKIKREMRKCDVVCANCHAIRTEKQRENGEFYVTPKQQPNNYRPSCRLL